MKPIFARVPALLAIAVLALVPASAQAPREPETVQRIAIRSQAIETFDPREPARKRFGALEFRGGLVLESPHRDFGGLSGLRMEPDGQHFIAVSDRGRWVRGRIAYRNGVPIAVEDAEMAPILGQDGRPLRSRGWYDTESLAGDGSTLYVGIERVHRIVRFDYAKDGLRARGRPIPVPPGIRLWPSNQSLECLALAPQPGSLIAISERALDSDGNITGFLIGKGGGSFSLRRSDEFDVSDCATAPNGRLLVLERRFSWLSGIAMRIRSVPLAALKPGAVVDGKELIVADMGHQIDNMEGLSVHRTADGATVLTLVSDDNLSPLQRTVLLQFIWLGE